MRGICCLNALPWQIPGWQFSSLLLPCSGVMRRLLWARDQHEVCRYIIACLDRMSSH